MGSQKPKLMLVLGIRPDVIRASILIKLLKESAIFDLFFVWSGQHYSDNLKDVFFRELDIPRPNLELKIDGSSDAEIVGGLIKQLYTLISCEKPVAVIYLGDTNTVASCIASAQHNIPIIHIEGCMRSYNWLMPEEKYRTLIDHLSDVIYTYFDEYKQQGVLEGLNPKNIVVTGNLIVDVLQEYYWNQKNQYDNYADSEFFYKRGLIKNKYFLMTCHRRENISDPSILKNIFNLAESFQEKVFFPAGYKTQYYIKEFGLILPKNVIMVDPIGYKDIITLMVNSKGVLTDSGTIVEEACVLQVKSIQMRTSTERPQVYDAKSSVKFDPVNLSEQQIRKVTKAFEALPNEWSHGLGDGHASVRIFNDLTQRVLNNELRGHLKDDYHIPTDRQYS